MFLNKAPRRELCAKRNLGRGAEQAWAVEEWARIEALRDAGHHYIGTSVSTIGRGGFQTRPYEIIWFSNHSAVWQERNPQRINLAPLSARWSQRMVEHVVGKIPEQSTRWIVEGAQGNPFYVQELLRVVAKGGEVGSPSA